ncbi:MAG TPA: NAD-binding protein [Syntrophomonadaceae bacterium]|nr:NAD-binding protein [Syntrophomonadaceae bacterium]
MKRGQGRMNVRVQNHFVICSYNYKAESIVKEIQKELPDAKIVLIADREENPMIHKEGVYFVRGDSAREAILEMAHVSKASTVIILADSVMSDQLADAHSVLTTLAVKELNPTCRVVAESLDPENTHHLTHAGADEIVCIGDITARLISRSSIHRGMTHLVAELMSSNSGNELYSVETPDHLVNLRFEDAFAEFRNKGAILVGTYLDGRMISNPPSDTILDKNAILIYIANAQVI